MHFPNSEPSIVNIVYGRSGIYGQFGLGYFMFSLAIPLKLIIFILFYYIVTFFSQSRSLLVPYIYASIEAIDCILLLSLAVNESR